MLAVLSEMPERDGGYGYEFKWDGYRALLRWDGSVLDFRSRNNLSVMERFAPLACIKKVLGRRPLILDGEIVALDAKGNSNFSLLQRHGLQAASLVYMAFDLLYAGERRTTGLLYTERRKLLEALPGKGPCWMIPPWSDSGEDLFRKALERGMEGIMAKRLDSLYESGGRSGAWRKIKITGRQEFVVGGWTSGSGMLKNSVGALLLGYYDSSGEKARLRYAGNIGTGFALDERAALKKWLEARASAQNPFSEPVPDRDARFVTPKLVIEVEFRGWTHGGRVRQGVFKGVRTDKKPGEVVLEKTVPEEKAA
jgi:bifunctional non-homologous end joining protein LigD